MYDAPKDEIASVLTFARAPRSFEIQNNKFPVCKDADCNI